jgi:type II secretory pathway pseudopilin PulG
MRHPHTCPAAARAARRRLGRGFTLIEVMVAGTFFLVSFAGMISGISYATKQYEHQRNLTAAIAVAETVMEQLMLLQQTHDSLSAGNTEVRYYDVDGNEVLSTASNRLFTGSWSTVGDTPVTGLRQVTLTISWQESSGNKNLSLTSVRP